MEFKTVFNSIYTDGKEFGVGNDDFYYEVLTDTPHVGDIVARPCGLEKGRIYCRGQINAAWAHMNTLWNRAEREVRARFPEPTQWWDRVDADSVPHIETGFVGAEDFFCIYNAEENRTEYPVRHGFEPEKLEKVVAICASRLEERLRKAQK